MGGGATPETKAQNTTQAIDQTQTGTSTAGPPAFIQPYLKQAVEGITPYLTKFNSTGGAPALYGDSYTVDPSDYTQSAKTGYASYNNPLAATNAGLTNQTLQGDYLNLDKNPYFQGALAASLRPATENFTNKVIPGLRSTFAGAGRPGGGLEGSLLQDATLNFSRAATDASAKVGAQAYGAEREAQLRTQSMLPSFQGMDFARLGLMKEAGNIQDTYLQKMRDEAVQRDIYSKTGGLDFLTGLSQRIQAAYPGGTTEGTTRTTGTTKTEGTATGTPAGNPGAENAKLAMAGVATAVSIAAMFV